MTEKVQADLAAIATNGGLSHFRLRLPQATDHDHSPDRLVLTAGPQLQVVFEYR